MYFVMDLFWIILCLIVICIRGKYHYEILVSLLYKRFTLPLYDGLFADKGDGSFLLLLGESILSQNIFIYLNF
jgi:hypothetical protein